jgi:acetolactate decarboxylase
MARKLCLSVLVCLLLVGIVLAGCSSNTNRYADNPVAGKETVTQISTLEALMNGVYDGVTTIGNLRKYGDFGIGTYAALDGEMVELDGNFYQVKADGKAYKVGDSAETPFAAVTFFDIDLENKPAAGINYEQLQKTIDGVIPTTNIFYAVKIKGTFSYMKTRSVPAQSKPYPVLSEVTKNQPTFEFQNITGTLVGWRCPAYVSGVNVAGYHLHFLTADLQAGGHVLELTLDNASVSIDSTPEFLMILPDKNSDFYKQNLTGGSTEDIEKVEK